jgi:hypothetical protein
MIVWDIEHGRERQQNALVRYRVKAILYEISLRVG